jgi:hypothetical protein
MGKEQVTTVSGHSQPDKLHVDIHHAELLLPPRHLTLLICPHRLIQLTQCIYLMCARPRLCDYCPITIA